MYCPKCGHQQVSEEMRFCSRCGFQLTGVAELLAAGDGTPAAPGQTLKRFPRISRRGARILFFSIVTAPVFLFFSYYFDSPVPLFPTFFFFLAGLARIFYQLIFNENMDSESQKWTWLTSGNKEQYLPPAKGIPAADLFGRETADFTPPPSITDPTTKLLETESELPFQRKR